jgi:hypothetical protein
LPHVAVTRVTRAGRPRARPHRPPR